MSFCKFAAVALIAALACVSGATGDGDRASSLLLQGQTFAGASRTAPSIPQLLTDDSSPRVEYSLQRSEDLDPAAVSEGAKICGVLVGIAAFVSLGLTLRDRAFPYYR